VVTKGIDRVVTSVGKLEDALVFYRDIVGMKSVANEILEPDEIQQLWNLPKGTQAHAAFLKIDRCSTLIEVVEFKPHSGKLIKNGVEASFYGLYDITFRVSGIDAIYRDLVERGFVFLTPPISYQPTFTPYAVKETFFLGPGNVPHGLIERMTGEELESRGHFKTLVDTAQIVEELNEVIRFYVDILGLDLMNQATIPEGLLEKLLGLPHHTSAKLAFINRKDSETLHVEIIQLSVKCKSLASIVRPPHLGLFMISFEVENLSSLLHKLSKERIAVLSGPIEINTVLYGRTRAITVEGPAGVMIELFER
jgi:catechol 2,3-dioxygenase-like lactoylglutathione lyase family enzyme